MKKSTGKGERKKSGGVLEVDFKDIETRKKVKPGNYLLKVAEIENKNSDKGKPYLNWKLVVAKGPAEGGTLYHITSLQPQALFTLKSTLEALGVEVPSGVMKLKISKYIGMELGGTVDYETFEGKQRSKIIDIFPAADLEEDEDEEEDDEEESDEEESEEEEEEESDEDDD